LPRYQGVLNENILAPAYWSNEGVETPYGTDDDYFIYSTPDPVDQPAIATWTVTAGVISTAPAPAPFEVQIDPGFDMYVDRILIDLQLATTSFPASLVGTVILGKIRTGAGFVLNDSFIDLERYLCGADYPARFRVRGGDSLFIDANLADIPAGASGTVTLQVFFEGHRRRAA
jgi:hypothetical protein